jgi:electron transfer flavoprotein alpha subunit
VRYRLIINGCSPGFATDCRAMQAIVATLPEADRETETIIFYSNPGLEAKYEAEAPTANILLIRIKEYETDLVLAVLDELESPDPADLYLFSGDYGGSELAIRFACRLDGSSLATVESLELTDKEIICSKSVYNGYMLGTFSLRKKPYCLSIARGMATGSLKLPTGTKTVSVTDLTGKQLPTYILEKWIEKAESDHQLEEAKFIVAGGRGVQNKDKLLKLQRNAAKLGAELGVSRPVAMNGWAPLDRLIGASGTIASPELCITAAVSGSPAFYIGIEKSKKIIAINIDSQAPMIEGADVAVIDRYETVIDQLVRLVEKDKTG